MKDALRASAAAGFRERFGREPEVVVVAPGRVNLLGAHVDYNDGCVMPIAIDRAIAIAGAKHTQETVELVSDKFNECKALRLDNLSAEGDWGDYPKGIISAHVQRGLTLGGFHAYFASDLPVGSGISSSAAVDVAVSALLQGLFHFAISGREVAQLAQQADHDFVGIRCGIMDQFVSAVGRAGHVLHLDCRSLAYEHMPIDLDRYCVLLIQSGVQRGLVDSEYNARRAECERGVVVLQRAYPDVRALRDVSPAMLEAVRGDMAESTYKRCRHVVDEIARVEAGAAALGAGDMRAFGQLIFESHASSRDWYEVSCPELDTLVEAAQGLEGSLGARVTGAGFGGCTVHLVEAAQADQVQGHIQAAFQQRFGRRPEALRCRSADGAFAEEA